MRYRKRPVEIEAIQWTGLNFDEVFNFCGTDEIRLTICNKILVPTLEGVMRANTGDWIIKGVLNEVYPCKDEAFRRTYERV